MESLLKAEPLAERENSDEQAEEKSLAGSSSALASRQNLTLPILPPPFEVRVIADCLQIGSKKGTVTVWPNLTCEFSQFFLCYTAQGFFFGRHRDVLGENLGDERGILWDLREQVYIEGTWRHGLLQGKAELVIAGQRFEAEFADNRLARSVPQEALGAADLPEHAVPGESYESLFGYLRSVTHPQLRGLAKAAEFAPLFVGDLEAGSEARHGVGSVFKADGSRFHGTWVRGSIEGFGVSVNRKGDIHIGWYRAGKPHSLGSTSLARDRYLGLFSAGQFEGPGCYFSEDSQAWLLGEFAQGDARACLAQEPGSGAEHLYAFDAPLLLRLLVASGQELQVRGQAELPPLAPIVA